MNKYRVIAKGKIKLMINASSPEEAKIIAKIQIENLMNTFKTFSVEYKKRDIEVFDVKEKDCENYF